MGRPKTEEAVLQRGFAALARGATWEAAAEEAGCCEMTLRRHGGADHVGMKPVEEPKVRAGAITNIDRGKIEAWLLAGWSILVIAARLGKNRSSIYREIARCGSREDYDAFEAGADAEAKARRPKQYWFEQRRWLWEIVVEMLLSKKWSPEQISKRFRKEHPDDPNWQVSHESIYQAIYVQPRGELRKQLIESLRHKQPKRRRRGSTSGEGRGQIKDMVNISQRPAEVEDRAVPGHWEGDLIVGKGGKSAVATIVERTTRTGMLIQLDNKTAEHVAQRLKEEIVRLPGELFKSLTWDQGKELADHAQFSIDTGIDVFFCDPHSPWQRGTNENWNGLVRQFLPKGTDLSVHTQEELDHIARLLNERPRKTLDWDTPAERFNQLVAATS